MPNALDIAYAVGAAALAPVWARKARGGWPQRLGRIDPLPPPPPGRRRLLLHAVSVGEVNTLRGLVPLLRESCDVVVASTTDTGLARAAELFGAGGRVVRFPLDFSGAVRRFLDAVAPDAAGLVELEVWPNFIAACHGRGVPVGVINGRLSARSFRGYRRIRPLIRGSFARLAFAAVQDDAYAERFGAMGAAPGRIHVTGSMKWDSVAAVPDPASLPGARALGAALGIDPARPLIVAGSTAEGEEALLHAACPGGVQLLCAPRRPERFDAAAAAMPGCRRRSQAGAARPGPVQGLASSKSPDRFLLDSLGELRLAYALADLAVVGRSFGRLHGSDPVEPVALGKPVVMGPAYANFETMVAALRDAGALLIATPGELRAVLGRLMSAPERRAEMAAKGLDCLRLHRGATERHAAMLLQMLAGAPASPPASPPA